MTSAQLISHVLREDRKRWRPRGSRRKKAYQRAMRRYIRAQSAMLLAHMEESSNRWHWFFGEGA